jgi:hypothetical protein
VSRVGRGDDADDVRHTDDARRDPGRRRGLLRAAVLDHDDDTVTP